MFFEFGIKDFIDILLVAFVLYYTYKLMKASGSIKVFTGILVFILIWLVVTQVLVVLVLLFLVFGYPRVVAFISDMQKPKTPQTEEFNPYTPITVVPNDYEE